MTIVLAVFVSTFLISFVSFTLGYRLARRYWEARAEQALKIAESNRETMYMWRGMYYDQKAKLREALDGR